MTPADVAARLRGWYGAHARDLPWRAPPGTPAPDPYRVWLSEVMLQQTTVAAAARYFAEFTRRWPTVESLAAADDGAVMAAWAGLGYYARARNLLACARAVAAAGGAFPRGEAALRALPGLGAYTAAAVAAIAFDERAVVIDVNVERVVARLFAIAAPLPAARAAIRAAAEAITPRVQPGDFAQAMMDLGATVCTPRAPRCLACPLADLCAGLASGAPDRFPVRPPKRARPDRRGRAYWITRDGEPGAAGEERGAVWLVRRPARGMLGGMRALPDNGWSARGDGGGAAPAAGPWRDAGAVRHGFTHFALNLTVMVHAGPGTPRGEGEWWLLARLGDAGLPTLFTRAAERALAMAPA